MYNIYIYIYWEEKLNMNELPGALKDTDITREQLHSNILYSLCLDYKDAQTLYNDLLNKK